MHKCPVCGGDRDEDISEIKRLILDHGFLYDTINPGGRMLAFKHRIVPCLERTLQIHDQCNACDDAAIRKFLGIPA